MLGIYRKTSSDSSDLAFFTYDGPYVNHFLFFHELKSLDSL